MSSTPFTRSQARELRSGRSGSADTPFPATKPDATALRVAMKPASAAAAAAGEPAAGDFIPSYPSGDVAMCMPSYPVDREEEAQSLWLDKMLGTPYPCEAGAGCDEEEAIDVVAVGVAVKGATPDCQAAPEVPTAAVERTPVAASPADAAADAAAEDGSPQRDAAATAPLAFDLAAALDDLSLGKSDVESSLLRGPLRGVPAATGRHTRFADDGGAQESPRTRVLLRGVPEPAGTYTRFEEGA